MAFLRARLDEDECYLRIMIEASEHVEEVMTEKDMADAFSMVMVLAGNPQVRRLMTEALDGILKPPNDLHRCLREAEAKRAILAGHEPEPWGEPHPELSRCGQGHGEEDGGYWTKWPCVEVRAIAAVWSDHPGYRDEWKP